MGLQYNFRVNVGKAFNSCFHILLANNISGAIVFTLRLIATSSSARGRHMFLTFSFDHYRFQAQYRWQCGNIFETIVGAKKKRADHRPTDDGHLCPQTHLPNISKEWLLIFDQIQYFPSWTPRAEKKRRSEHPLSSFSWSSLLPSIPGQLRSL